MDRRLTQPPLQPLSLYKKRFKLWPCTPGETNLTVPALMRLFARNCVAFSACIFLIVICSCERHRLGEMPEVQREKADAEAGVEKNPSAEASPTPAAQPTPAE